MVSTMNHTILEQHGLSNLVEAATALATFSLCSRAPTVPHDIATQICSPPVLQISPSLPSTVNRVVLGQSPCSTASSHANNEKLFSPICADANDACKETFPERLMAILNDDSVSSDIISWLPNGLSFIIARPDLFMESILPKYITPMQQQQDARTLSTKYPSFTRKLNRWGFRQVTRGPETGAFHHPLFRRDQPELCLEMFCQRTRSTTNNKTERKLPKSAPLKKRRVSALTKESLEVMNQEQSVLAFNSSNLQTVEVAKPVTVSEDSQSMKSSLSGGNTPSIDSFSAKLSPTYNHAGPLLNGSVTNNPKLVHRAITKRNEEERMRLAKIMLYNSFLQAMNGEDSI